MTWPKVALREVVVPIERAEAPRPGKRYRQLGVRLWGAGPYERDPMDGTETKYAQLCRVEENDLVVNKIWARNGSVGVVPAALAGAYVSGEFPTFKPDSSRVRARWLHWLTKWPEFWVQCEMKSQGTSGKNRIRPEQFLSVEIPLPPLDEQRRIVARLDAVASRVDLASSLRSQADMLSTRLPTLMAHRRDLAEEDKERAGWKLMALADCLEKQRDICRVDPLQEYPNVGMYSFGRGLFPKPPIVGSMTTAPTLNRISAGQFIYSRLFAFEGAYGWVSPEFDGSYVSNEYPTFDCKPGIVRAEFVAAYFRLPEVWRAMAHGSKGLGDRRQRVQPEKILEHELWVPPMAWQDRLASVEDQVRRRQGEAEMVGRQLEALTAAVLAREMAPVQPSSAEAHDCHILTETRTAPMMPPRRLPG